MTVNKTRLAIGWCEEHEKLEYTSRKRARHVARQHHPSKSTYRCDVNPQLWHVGSLPSIVKQGHVDKDEYFGGAA